MAPERGPNVERVTVIGGRLSVPLDEIREVLAREGQHEFGRARKPSPDHEVTAVKDDDQIGQSERQPPTDLAHEVDRLIESLVRRPGHVLGTDILGAAVRVEQRREAPFFRGVEDETAKSTARRVSFPTTHSPARARNSVRLDHHVSDLAGETTAALQQRSVGDDPATDPGTEGHHHEVVDTAPRAPRVLGERRAVGVVLAEHPFAREGVTQHGAHVRPRRTLQVRRVRESPVLAQKSGQSNTDRRRWRRQSSWR